MNAESAAGSRQVQVPMAIDVLIAVGLNQESFMCNGSQQQLKEGGEVIHRQCRRVQVELLLDVAIQVGTFPQCSTGRNQVACRHFANDLNVQDLSGC